MCIQPNTGNTRYFVAGISMLAAILDKTTLRRIIELIVITFVISNCTRVDNSQTKQLTQTQIDSLKKNECDSILKTLHSTQADTLGHIKTIPSDFNGCLDQLDTLINDKMKSWIKCLPDKEFGYRVHMDLGAYLRNNWKLWQSTELTKKLQQMGIFHPDDMTGVILTSYQRKLKGEDIKLQEQIDYYKEFWRNKGTPIDSILESKNKKQ